MCREEVKHFWKISSYGELGFSVIFFGSRIDINIAFQLHVLQQAGCLAS
jgi:hypothetical protein